MKQEDYLYGDCHIFAQALHQVFGYQMHLAIDKFDLELETDVLVHAYCTNGNHAIDARGVIAEADILEAYDYNDIMFRYVNMDELKALMDSGYLHHPEAGQMEEVIRYIEENRGRYQTRQPAYPGATA